MRGPKRNCWTAEERGAIYNGIRMLKVDNSDEANEVARMWFETILSISYDRDREGLERFKTLEQLMMDDSHPVYPKLVPPKELVREIHVRLRNMNGMETVPIDEFKAVLKWHSAICECGSEWGWNREG